MQVIFVDEFLSSKFNGIGTFRDTLLGGLISNDISCSIISLSCNVPDFAIDGKPIKRFCFPNYTGGWRNNGEQIFSILHKHIPDSKNLIFIINHSPCSGFLKILKQYFPSARIVFIIHNQLWCNNLFGNSESYIKIIKSFLSPSHSSLTEDEISQEIISDYKEECKIYNLVDAVVCLCNETLEIVNTLYPISLNKLVCIPNGIQSNPSQNDIDHSETQQNLRKYLRLESQQKILLFAGRIVEQKGIQELLTALTMLDYDPTTPIKLAIVGNLRNIHYFESEIKNIAAQIIFTGHLCKSELTNWYKISDFGILPSFTEQCSFVGLEMMKYNLPIIASDGFGIREMFCNKNAFIAKICNNSNTFALNIAKAILRAINASTAEKDYFKQFNRNLLLSKYNRVNMITSYLNLLNKLLL